MRAACSSIQAWFCRRWVQSRRSHRAARNRFCRRGEEGGGRPNVGSVPRCGHPLTHRGGNRRNARTDFFRPPPHGSRPAFCAAHTHPRRGPVNFDRSNTRTSKGAPRQRTQRWLHTRSRSKVLHSSRLHLPISEPQFRLSASPPHVTITLPTHLQTTSDRTGPRLFAGDVNIVRPTRQNDWPRSFDPEKLGVRANCPQIAGMPKEKQTKPRQRWPLESSTSKTNNAAKENAVHCTNAQQNLSAVTYSSRRNRRSQDHHQH